MSGTKPLPICSHMARYARLKILLAMGPKKEHIPEELVSELRRSIRNDQLFHENETEFPVWTGHKLHGKEGQ